VVRVSPTVITFTNLFPSAVMPTHGVFVRERMSRLLALRPQWRWQVVSPVPEVAWFFRSQTYRRWHAVPASEQVGGITVHHPRYRHWPGLSLRRQADAMAQGAERIVTSLAAERPVVLDAHYLWPDGVAASILARKLGIPYVLTARGTDVNVVASDHVVAGRIAEAADGALACFAVSGALCDRFAQVTGLARTRITEVRNGVDLDRFKPGDAQAARARLALPLQGRLLLGVGRLVESKGFLLAARALASLPRDVHLVLVGEGPQRSEIAEAGGDRVHFLGARLPDDVADAFRACDLFVLPTEREGWPNVVTEALASGLRVVASAVGGIPEILGGAAPADGSLGALVPPRDESALLSALQRILEAPGDRALVRTFAERWSWNAPLHTLTEVFDRALGAGAVP
jgi:teichuronic acid biosynthesis glycosyltransferase TuaC